ncbi:MAG TPA: hypothetical protein VFR26_02260 [Acidimicrobiales bacterium]|nr:hypothetical protein [Acidimicrobiales bacterium]
MTAVLARKMWRTLEPYHGLVYFTPHATAAYAALGVIGQAGYFASRAAPMGPVPAGVVIATFYNFDPRVVRAAVPAVWEAASPADITAARLGAIDLALRDALGEDALASSEVAEAAALACRAAGGCTPEGRPLYAAHAELAWPDEPHLALWHAVTLLREFRGDGHVAALVAEGLDGCEALVTHGAMADVGLPTGILQATRGWSDDAWGAARDRLRHRGLLDDGGALTPAGAAVRDHVEAVTDEQAMAPWRHLGEDDADRLRTLVRPFSKAIAASGAFRGRPAS